MQRMALSIAHEALEMSGYVPNRTRSTKLDRIGTFYRQTSDGLREISPAQEVDTYFISAGIKALGPGRINYYFGSLGNLGTAYSSNTLGQEANLALLLVREAQKLLLLELDRRESSSQDDIKFSMDLVQSMGFLPVGIHAIAQRLKAKDKPLSTFARGYTCTPRLRGLGTYTTAVDPPDRALEGLNLIHLLCYSSQHVPPEVAALISISESADFQKHGSVEDQAVHETLRNNLT
ncbi:hypothetical protein BDZ45DRAFT_196903 [Acephala macrosclerotiorum]|nr:hypothetical protein BDZ45DRAFT_196903 [Acephala macrosclerotiorum]